MALSADAVRQELLQLAIERNLIASFADGGTFTCTDAAYLVLRMAGDSPDVATTRLTSAKVFRLLKRHSTVDAPVTKQTFPTALLGLVTYHFANAWCPPDIIEAVGRELRVMRADEDSKRRRRAMPVASQHVRSLMPIADATTAAAASSTVAAEYVAGAPAAIVQHDVTAFASRADFENLLSVVHHQDDTINKLGCKLRRRDNTIAVLKDDLRERDLTVTALLHQARFRTGEPGTHCSKYGRYHIALARNKAHVGASTILDIVAGTDLQGKLRDKNLVYCSEHLAAGAKTLIWKQMHAPEPNDEARSIAVYCYKSDFTHENAVEKSSVHVSAIHTTTLPDLDGALAESIDPTNGVIDMAGFASQLQYATTTPDLLSAEGTTHTGAITYAFALREFASVGVPDWVHACSPAYSMRRTVYCMGLDGGPDNLGCLRRMKTQCKDSPNVFLVVVFCFMHILHLIVGDALSVLDKWSWQEGDPNMQYFKCVSSVAYTWRGPGCPRRICNAAESVWSYQIMKTFFKRIPGAPIRSRWGAISSVEKIIRAASSYIHAVFARTFSSELDQRSRRRERRAAAAAAAAAAKAMAKAKAHPADASDGANGLCAKPGADDSKAYRDEQRMVRCNAVDNLGNPFVMATLIISDVVKKPIIVAMLKDQKNHKEYAERVAAAKACNRAYLGPTPLSEFVCGGAKKIDGKLNSLFDASSLGDPDLFGDVFKTLADEYHSTARQLIVTLLLTVKSGWQRRAMNKVVTITFFAAAAPAHVRTALSPLGWTVCQQFHAYALNETMITASVPRASGYVVCFHFGSVACTLSLF
jgi:hypothetical protein